MSLTYDLTKISQEIQESEKMSDTTYRMIWATLMVDIGIITTDNAEEFLARTMLMDSLYGTKPFTLDEVRAHIGLKTNVPTLTRAKFLKKVSKFTLTGRMRDFEQQISKQKGGEA